MSPSSTELTLTPEIKALIDSALETDHPLLLAAVGDNGAPLLSFRGSARTFSDHQIGLWIRNRSGGTLDAIGVNPHVALMYRSETVPMLQFHGLAHIVDDTAVRDRIFDRSPQRERDADPDRNGVAVLIDLTRVEGVTGFIDGAPHFVRLERPAT